MVYEIYNLNILSLIPVRLRKLPYIHSKNTCLSSLIKFARTKMSRKTSSLEYFCLYYSFLFGILCCGYSAYKVEKLAILANTLYYWIPQIVVLGLTAFLHQRPAFLSGVAIGISFSSLIDAFIESRLQQNSLPLVLYYIELLPAASFGIFLANKLVVRWGTKENAIKCGTIALLSTAIGPFSVLVLNYL